MDYAFSLIAAVLSCGPCAGFAVYLWKEKRRIAAVGGLLPGLIAVALAVCLLLLNL